MSYMLLLIFTASGIGGTITTNHSIPMSSLSICQSSSEDLLAEMTEQKLGVIPQMFCIQTKGKKKKIDKDDD